MNLRKIVKSLQILTVLTFGYFILSDSLAFGQQIEIRNLLPNEKIERQMTGKEGHYYGFELKENEFLQVRIEQKGIDIFVRVLSKEFKPLASWYGVTGNQGFETLSFIAPKDDIYLLGIAMSANKSDKGSYVLERGDSRTATAQDKRRVEAESLFVKGTAAADPDAGLSMLAESLLIWKEIGDSYMESQTIALIFGIKRYKAESIFGEAMELAGKDDEESHKKAISKFQNVLELFKELGDREFEAKCLGWLGKTHYFSGENQKALESLNLALSIFREINNKQGESQSLISIGTTYYRMGEYLNGIEFTKLAIPILNEINDQNELAKTLVDIGLYYRELGDRERSTESFKSSLPILTKIGDRKAELTTLNNIGVNYWYLRESRKALEYYNHALRIAKEIGAKDIEANTLNNIGETYNTLLRDFSEALKYFDLALQIRKTVINKTEEGKILNNIGTIYMSQGVHEKALLFFNQALSIFSKIGEKPKEITTLTNIGIIYKIQGSNEKALEFIKLALQKLNELNQRDDAYKATVLRNLGDLYLESGERGKAMGYLAQALSISKFVGDKVVESEILSNMAIGYAKLYHRRMAIFFYKLYINKLQDMRGTAQGLDSASQKLLLSRFTEEYQTLASILIAEGEYALAVQVLNLYQDQQFFDYNPDTNTPVEQAALSPREQKYADKYDALGKKLGELNSQIENLTRQTKNRPPTELESAQLKKLQPEFETATQEYYSAFNKAYQDFTGEPDESDKISTVKDVEEVKEALSKLNLATKQNTATIYTFIDSGEFHTLFLTSDGQVKHFGTPIKSEDFNKKILNFYALLQSPTYDPRPLGTELYNIIIRPVEAELNKQNIKTLMWQLDGNLRYIPMAALFDGQKYLAEKYQTVVFTRADTERILKPVKPNWTGTGFGSSQAQTVDLGDGNRTSFSALPGVTAELNSIFQIGKESKGILSGEVISDKQFTKEAFYNAVSKKRSLVHISSHFAFRPGDDSRSYLLLGDGTPLTLNEMKKQENLFEGVELLTLSACNTAATQADANGREIDGFAELAQRLGAGAVMATLWQVSDASTPWLMRDFYSNRESQSGITKAEALRSAQLGLLSGTAEIKQLPDAQKGSSNSRVKIVIVPKGNTRADFKSQARSDVIYLDESQAPLFQSDRNKPFAHPFYWSPFLLYGNWR